jgi:Zn-dependent metalloprotease
MKYLYDHNSQESSYVVEDYPWGFRLRTKIRYWVESKDAANGGQRFVAQTLNPKTNVWCAPKKSVYYPVIIMFLDEKGHVKYEALNTYNGIEVLTSFKQVHINNLSKFQQNQLKFLLACHEVMKHVTFTVKASEVGSVSLLSKDPIEVEKRKRLLEESERREKENKECLRKINRAIAYETQNISL